VPEICKKSLSACPCTGGMELFILGKNFLKDTQVVFQEGDALLETPWEESVQPDKEFLQQTHLVCVVPRYRRLDIIEPVTVRLLVVSSGKTSEPHTFTYNPTLQPSALTPEGTQPCVTLVQSAVSHRGADVPQVFARSTIVPGAELLLHDTGPSSVAAGPGKSSPKKSQYLPIEPSQIGETEIHPVMMWQSSSLLPPPDTQNPDNKTLESKELDRVLSGKMMPPPLLPIGTRRASTHLRLIVPDTDAASVLAEKLKTEMTEETSSQSPEDVKGIDLRLKPAVTMNSLASVADLSSTQSPTMATFQQFVTGCTNTPLPNQSAQSVEKYLSNLERATDTVVVTKTSSDCLASTSKVADTVASKSPDICLSTDTGNPSQFDSASTLFGQQHSVTTQGSVDPKLQYVSDLPISVLYNAQPAAKTTGQEGKLQFPSEETSLLQQVTAARHKSVFDETLTISPNSDTVLGGRRPIMIIQESQSVPMMNAVSEASALLCTASGLIYGSPDRSGTSSLLPVSTQSTETDVLDSLSKGSSSVGIVGSVGDSAILSGPSPVLSNHVLAVTQPSIITSPTSVRVDALVSTAVNSHVMGSDNCVHSSNTDKLDALVNSTAVSHMIPAPVSPSDNIVLRRTPVEASLRQQEIKTTDQMSPVPVTEMPDTGLGSFDLLPGQHSNVHISRENAQLLNDTMSVAVNSHLLVTHPKAEMEAGVQLSTSALSSPTGNALYTSHGQTSPIVMKNLILNTSIGTTSDGQILVASPTQTSPVSLKSMLLESSDAMPHNHILASGSTSPIAVKKMVTTASQMLISSPTSASMENIMTSAVAQQDSGQMMATGLTCTSPVGMKNMIFESTASDSCLANPSHTSPIAVKTMILNSQLSGNVDERVIPRTADQSAQNARLDELVHSTLNGNAFVVSNVTQVTSALDIHKGDGITILSKQGHVQQSSEAHTTPPLISQPSACITTLITQPSEPSSHLQLQAGATDGTLINTLFTSRSPTDPHSSLQVHSFNKEGSLRIGTDPQTSCCTNGSALLHASQFTTASSHSQSTVTGITMSSKLAEEIAEHSSNTSSQLVTQLLLDLAAHEKMKDSEIALMSRDKITESLQQVDNFSDSKVPETRLFAAPEMLKVTVGDLLKSRAGTVPNSHCQGQVTTISDLVLTKQQGQEVQGLQCKEQQHSSVPQTKTCVTENIAANQALSQKKGEEGMVPQELTQMSENDLLSYINPSAFDQV